MNTESALPAGAKGAKGSRGEMGRGKSARYRPGWPSRVRAKGAKGSPGSTPGGVIVTDSAPSGTQNEADQRAASTIGLGLQPKVGQPAVVAAESESDEPAGPADCVRCGCIAAAAPGSHKVGWAAQSHDAKLLQEKRVKLRSMFSTQNLRILIMVPEGPPWPDELGSERQTLEAAPPRPLR